MMTDRRTSELIDDVAREMTAIHTMPPVRARVLARLDTVRRRAPGPYFTWATVAAALLIVCVMVIPTRPPSATRTRGGPTAPAARATDTTTAVAPRATPTEAVTIARSTSATRSTASEVDVESPAEREWRARRIAELPAIDAGAIQPGTLDLPLLSMAPATTAPIVMTPLSSDDNDLD